MRVFLAGAILPFIAPFANGQFQSLATTDDGAVLYFGTELRQKGTDQPFYGKIYRLDAKGVSLFSWREKVDPGPPPGGPGQHGSVTNYFRLSAPDVSGDGKVISMAATQDCYWKGVNVCAFDEHTRTELADPGGNVRAEFAGMSRLSENGRYAARLQFALGRVGSVVISELSTGNDLTPATTGVLVSPVGRVISNGGEFACFYADGLHLVKPGDKETSFRVVGDVIYEYMNTETPTDGPVLDAQGEIIVFPSRWQLPGPQFSRIRIFRRSDSSIRTLVEGPGDYFAPVVSNDGSRVLFLSTANPPNDPGRPQAFIINIDGSGLRKLTDEPAGAATAILSGDGRVAYAVSSDNRLIRIDVDSGAITELIGATAYVTAIAPFTCCFSGPIAAGSLAHATGGGFIKDEVSARGPDLPRQLGPFSATIGSIPVPLLYVSPAEFAFQVPWELAAGTYNLVVSNNANTGWETSRSVDVAIAVPGAVYTPDGPVAAHSDWSALVTSSNPAHAGETVHIYATGLGPVTPPVETGVAAPVRPPAQLTSPLTCSHGTQRVPVPVSFAGLAPGTAGLYQIDVQVPARDATDIRDYVTIGCPMPGGGGFAVTLPFGAQ